MSAPGAAPILVIGNTGDPATPYEGARRMADELGKGVGVELTYKGEGHGAYGSGSDCVDVTRGRLPAGGKGPGGRQGLLLRPVTEAARHAKGPAHAVPAPSSVTSQV